MKKTLSILLRLKKWFLQQRFFQVLLILIVIESYAIFILWPYIVSRIEDKIMASKNIGPLQQKTSRGHTFKRGTCYPEKSISPPSFICDNFVDSLWLSADSIDDLFLGIQFPNPFYAVRIIITPVRRSEGLHMRDLSVVAYSDYKNGVPHFHIIRSRLNEDRDFNNIITVPEDWPGGKPIVIELDPTDKDLRPYSTWGVACLSASRGYDRNYLTNINTIAIHEMDVVGRRTPKSHVVHKQKQVVKN